MNERSNELVKVSAIALVELANHSGVAWDEAYLMYEESESHTGGTQTYRNGRSLKYFDFEFDDDVAEKLEESIWLSLGELFKEIKSLKGKSPSSCIINVTKDYDYKIKFSYSSDEGTSIKLLDLGKAISFYSLDSVDIPESIKKAQKNGL